MISGLQFHKLQMRATQIAGFILNLPHAGKIGDPAGALADSWPGCRRPALIFRFSTGQRQVSHSPPSPASPTLAHRNESNAQRGGIGCPRLDVENKTFFSIGGSGRDSTPASKLPLLGPRGPARSLPDLTNEPGVLRIKELRSPQQSNYGLAGYPASWPLRSPARLPRPRPGAQAQENCTPRTRSLAG